jgi:hypothetical protein
MEMTKFEDLDDPGFIAVAGEVRRWVKALVIAESTYSSGWSAEGLSTDRDGPEAGKNVVEPQVKRITQGGSVYSGPTTVSGGSLFQGNYIG